MGRQAYPIIGGIIGAVVAAFATDGAGTLQGYEAGFAIGAAIGGIAGSYIDPILIQGNKIGSSQTQTAAEGGARAIMYGQACVTATCIVARGNRKVVKKKQSNGKGSSGATQNETVTWTFAIGLCEAIVGGVITRVWQDETLVYDTLDGSTISAADNDKFSTKFRFYDGNESQLPDADLQVFLGEDTPYFRGTAYVVFPNFDLTQTSERIPTFKFEIIDTPAILDTINNLGVELHFSHDQPSESNSITLSGTSDVVYNADLYITGTMETRNYIHITKRVGGQNRFVAATDSTAGLFPTGNIFRVTVSDPPQTYFVNAYGPHEAGGSLFLPNSGNNYRLPIQIAGNATIECFADPVDGLSGFVSPQFFTITKTQFRGFDRGGSSSIPISEIIASLMLRAGMAAEQFDVTALAEDIVAGVCIQDSVTGIDAINACVGPFFADPCEKDRVLTFVKRGAAVLRTLTVDDLTAEPDVMSRENAIEYPAKLHFFYQSPQTGYAMTKATSYRYSPQADSSGEGSVTAPITFADSNVPAQIAQKLHKVMWSEADGSFSWTVGSHCIDLIPTDVVGLFLRGIATRARITATENDGKTIKLSMMKDRQSSYTSAVTGIPLPTPAAPQPASMSQAVLAVMDIPALIDTDDQLCYYTAISGSTGVWRGAQLQRSLDAGATWTPIGDVTTDVTMGRLTVGITAADSNYTDTTNTVTVKLFDNANELVAFSDTTFMQEQGGICVQLDDGTWEVMQYRDVVDNGSGSWTLSHLQRGRLNTVAGTHAIDSLFVLLEGDIVKNSAQTAWLGGTLMHRAVSYSTSAEDATVVSTTFTGLSQIEWSPANASADYDGTYVYVYGIVPRHRFGTEVNPVSSVNFQGYRITLTDGTTTVTSDILSTSAHVIAAPLSTVTGVTVAELNKLTGPGDALAVVPRTVTAGSLSPEAVINAGGGS